MPPPDLEEGWCETGDPLLGLAVPGLGSKCGIIPGLRSGLAKVGLRTALAAPEPPNDTPPKLDLEAMDVCHNNYINGCYMWYMVNPGSFFNTTWEVKRGAILRDIEFFPRVLNFYPKFFGFFLIS